MMRQSVVRNAVRLLLAFSAGIMTVPTHAMLVFDREAFGSLSSLEPDLKPGRHPYMPLRNPMHLAVMNTLQLCGYADIRLNTKTGELPMRIAPSGEPRVLNVIAVGGAAANTLPASPADNVICLIRDIAGNLPMRRAGIEAMLGVRLHHADENHVFEFYKGAGPRLADGVMIETIDLRLHKTNPDHQGFLVMHLGDGCLRLSQLRALFPALQISEPPHPDARDPMTTHSAMLNQGRIGFSVRESRPDCVASLILDPGAKDLFE